MAEQRQVRFRLPWLSAVTAAPPPMPELEPPPPPTTTEIRAPPRPTATISIQRPPFRPVAIPETPLVQLPATQRSSSPSPTTEPQPKSPVTVLTSPTESRVASLPANQIEPIITPPLTKSQSFVPVEELKLSEPRSKGDIAENRTQPRQKPSYVSENLKSESTNREEEIGTEEDNLRNRVAALLSSVATNQTNELSHKEEIKNPSKGMGSSDKKIMGSSSHSNGGEQVPLHREIKQDIFKLIQKVSQGQLKNQIGELPASVITLSGKNMGATKHISLGNRPAMAYINSNTQSINNSIMFESNVNGRDPGVHLCLTHSNQADFEMSTTSGDEGWAQRSECCLTPANKLTHEPHLRTRLFVEETGDSDPDKPRSHGCIDRDVEIL